MFNSILEMIVRHKQIIPIIVAVAAIGAYMIPMNTFASGGGANVDQSISQSNTNVASNSGSYGSVSASGNTQANIASNTADVHYTGQNSKHHVNIGQSIDQSNTNIASNTGDHGTVTADNNLQENIATNNADVHYKGYSHSKNHVNINQDIQQSNTNIASNSGDHSTVTANDNTQANEAQNTAHYTGSHHSSSHVDISQHISQSNTNVASNSGSNSEVHADHNAQTNVASNNADVS